MTIYVIIGQRKERYPGEYAPEVLDAIDEFGNDENAGEWIIERLRFWRSSDEFEAVESIPVHVDSKTIMERLRPNLLILKGEIVKE